MLVVIQILTWLGFATSLPWRLAMMPLSKWWRNVCLNHLKRTVRVGEVRVKAVIPSDNLPYLCLLVRLENGSETTISVKRIYGSIYIGDWRIANFDAHQPIEKNLTTNRQQPLTIQERVIKRGSSSKVEFNFCPPMEFWVFRKSNSSLGDGGIEVTGYGVNVVIPLFSDNMPIENLEQAASSYREQLSTRDWRTFFSLGRTENGRKQI